MGWNVTGCPRISILEPSPSNIFVLLEYLVFNAVQLISYPRSNGCGGLIDTFDIASEYDRPS
jgi:hypothetical protein